MLFKLVSVVFCSGERQAWCDDTFNGGVVGQVQEQSDTIQTSVLLKVLFEIPGSLHVHTHSGKNDREVVLVSIVYVLGWALHEARLPHDLRSDLVPASSFGEPVNIEGARIRSLRCVGDRRLRKWEFFVHEQLSS